MRVDFAAVATLFRHEIRQLLRDRRTVVLSIGLPLLVMPLAFYAAHVGQEKDERRRSETSYLYAITGPEAGAARELFTAQGAGAPFRAQEITVEDAAAALERSEIHFYIDTEQRPGDVPLLTVVFRSNRDLSRSAGQLATEKLQDALEARRDELLRESGFPLPPARAGEVSELDVASAGERTGSLVGRFLTLLVVFLVFSGGAVVAIDSVAGEKERGTLETLLTTALGRGEIVAAKHLAILAVALAITAIQVLNLLIYVGLGLIRLPEGFVVDITPATGLLVFLLLLPAVALLATVLLLISGLARSYKEAQLYFLPAFLAGLVPALAAALPGIGLRSAIVLLPLANISVAVREVLVGRIDGPMLALAWLITAGAALWLGRTAARTLVAERLVAGPEPAAAALAGPGLFRRRVLLWFGLMWVVMFVVASNVEALAGLRSQVVFNIVVIFCGASALMIARYRLDPREALSLRAPHPAAWFAVLAGAPAGVVAATGVFRLASLLFPVPEKMIEAFGQTLVPEGIPAWQLFVFLALLPGVGEEIAFRGMLLHGLRPRLRPLRLCLAVGVIFGLFHVALFRLIPTAFLGVILAAVVLLSGSIFPAMLWHALNNAIGIGATMLGADLGELPAGIYLAGAAVLALAFWILWRTRRYGDGRGASYR
ncbi:MAG: CPBP family intramembrane metalloprotease [Acidobacteria bacterium]|nr:CPBP family intramembrane metalloprotease [Acidobacteriota bacterium]